MRNSCSVKLSHKIPLTNYYCGSSYFVWECQVVSFYNFHWLNIKHIASMNMQSARHMSEVRLGQTHNVGFASRRSPCDEWRMCASIRRDSVWKHHTRQHGIIIKLNTRPMRCVCVCVFVIDLTRRHVPSLVLLLFLCRAHLVRCFFL